MRQKKISREEYVKLYCTEKRFRGRKALYVSAETHQKIMRIANLFRDEYVTVASLTDAIMRHHITGHTELLNLLWQMEREILVKKNLDMPEDEYEQDDLPDDEGENEDESEAEPDGSL